MSRNLKIAIFLALISTHLFLLQIARSYITPELIFPVWLLSNAKVFVSEVQTAYPQLLLYILSGMTSITGDISLSFNLVQMTLVAMVDSFLFYYLNKKLNHTFALAGLLFYVPWQIFFRGNYLWFDFTTIPFLILSYIYFEKYIAQPKQLFLIISASILALGYFFKLTVLWIFILYFLWIVIASFSKKRIFAVFKSTVSLFTPLLIAVVLNFLLALSKNTLDFTFYWNIIMQWFIYPRMSALTRPIDPNYYSPLILLLITYAVSCMSIQKYLKLPNRQKWFLFTFTLVSFAYIFPRWSDFHVQPGLVFLAIIFAAGFYSRRYLKFRKNLYYIVFLAFIILASLIIFTNRVVLEKKSEVVSPDNSILFAPSDKTQFIKGKKVFLYDFQLYTSNYQPIDTQVKLTVLEHITSGFKSPDDYYRTISWQKALNYAKDNNPDIIFVPHQIHERMIAGKNLTGFERFIVQGYHHQTDVQKIYFMYIKNQRFMLD